MRAVETAFWVEFPAPSLPRYGDHVQAVQVFCATVSSYENGGANETHLKGSLY